MPKKGEGPVGLRHGRGKRGKVERGRGLTKGGTHSELMHYLCDEVHELTLRGSFESQRFPALPILAGAAIGFRFDCSGRLNKLQAVLAVVD